MSPGAQARNPIFQHPGKFGAAAAAHAQHSFSAQQQQPHTKRRVRLSGKSHLVRIQPLGRLIVQGDRVGAVVRSIGHVRHLRARGPRVVNCKCTSKLDHSGGRGSATARAQADR